MLQHGGQLPAATTVIPALRYLRSLHCAVDKQYVMVIVWLDTRRLSENATNPAVTAERAEELRQKYKESLTQKVLQQC